MIFKVTRDFVHCPLMRVTALSAISLYHVTLLCHQIPLYAFRAFDWLILFIYFVFVLMQFLYSGIDLYIFSRGLLPFRLEASGDFGHATDGHHHSAKAQLSSLIRFLFHAITLQWPGYTRTSFTLSRWAFQVSRNDSATFQHTIRLTFYFAYDTAFSHGSDIDDMPLSQISHTSFSMDYFHWFLILSRFSKARFQSI